MLQLKRGKGDSISGGLHSDELVVALDGRESVSRASLEGSGGFVKEEEEEVVFTRDNRGGSAQHATRATPTRSNHGPMRA